MRPKTFFSLFGIILGTISLAQSSFPSFVRSYGGTDTEIPRSIILLPDSGYIISGSTRSFGSSNTNIYLFRTDKYGDTLWTRVIGNGGESSYCVRLTIDDGLVLANSQNMLLGNGANLMKFDLSGNFLWSKAYGDTILDRIYDLKIAKDNGIIAIGNSINANPPKSDLFIMKTDSNGVLQWGKHYGGTKTEDGKSIVPLSDGGYIACGSTNSYNNSLNNAWDAMLLRINSIGDTIWAKRYSAVPISVTGLRVLALNDGGFLIAGVLQDTIPNMMKDIFLLRTDSIGDIIWTKKYIKAFDEWIDIVISTDNDGFLLGGQTASPDTNDWDIYLIQTDNVGDTLWTTAIGGDKHDVARDIINIKGGYAILSQSVSFGMTGLSTDYDIAVLLTDSSGNINCFKKAITPMTVSSSPFTVSNISPPIKNYCIQVSNTPQITTGGLLTDWCNISTSNSSSPIIKATLFISPNPFSSVTTLQTNNILNNATVIIYNSYGQTVKEIININDQTIILYRDHLPSGLYFIRLTQDNKVITADKLVITD